MANSLDLSLTVAPDAMRGLCRMTARGFLVAIPAACTLESLLLDRMGIDADYLAARIQDLFLDSQVVDDPRTTTVTPGAVVGLSGAMPGIAGAMLRKGSRISPMRSAIAAGRATSRPIVGKAGDVTVRLFNVLQRELGPALLAQGIRVPAPALGHFLRGQSDRFRQAIYQAQLDGHAVPTAALGEIVPGATEVRLRVALADQCSTHT